MRLVLIDSRAIRSSTGGLQVEEDFQQRDRDEGQWLVPGADSRHEEIIEKEDNQVEDVSEEREKDPGGFTDIQGSSQSGATTRKTMEKNATKQ